MYIFDCRLSGVIWIVLLPLNYKLKNHIRNSLLIMALTYADPERVFRGGSNIFLVKERIQIPLKSGHHRPASEALL